MNIEKAIENYKKIGYEFEEAKAKVSQDIILLKISKSKYANNITIKGGVVMHSISNDLRRATRDIDLDFIKYSLSDESIFDFIEKLNCSEDDIQIEIVGKIEKLHHQDYDGKRVNLKIVDEFNYAIETKLDIGVHKLFDIKQEEYCFNLEVYGKTAKLLINSLEQIFTEKLKTFLKLSFWSTRYKDIFDFYYLIDNNKLESQKLKRCIEILIFEDEKMKENNMQDIINRLKKTFNSQIYINSLSKPKVNWLDIPIQTVINTVLNYFTNLK